MLTKDRNIGLDVLRSLAIWNVILMHLAIIFYAAKITKIVWFPIPDGVDLFFVLSGFLIGKIMIKNFVLQRNTNKEIIKFIISRWFRTLPNYYIMTFIVFVMTVLASRQFFIPIYNLTFTQNISPKILNFYAETWSLCVEEWYYILFPLLIFIFTKANLIKLNSFLFLLIIGCIILISPIIRFFYAQDFIYQNAKNFLDYRMITFIRLDAIAYGTLAAYFALFYKDIWYKNKNIFFIFGLTLLTLNTTLLFLILNDYIKAFHGYITNYNFIINSIAILLMLPKIESLKINSLLLKRIFTTTSLISYSMYLLQMTIILRIAIVIYLVYFTPSLLTIIIFIVVYLIVLYIFSYWSYRFIELPFLRLREKVLHKYFN